MREARKTLAVADSVIGTAISGVASATEKSFSVSWIPADANVGPLVPRITVSKVPRAATGVAWKVTVKLVEVELENGLGGRNIVVVEKVAVTLFGTRRALN